LAAIGPRFARAGPAIGRNQLERALFGGDRGEFRPDLGANAKHSHGSDSHEREADNTSNQSKDGHFYFPQHWSELLLSHRGGGTSVSGSEEGLAMAKWRQSQS